MRALLIAAFALVWLVIPGTAQQLIAARAGLISYSEGEVYLNGKAVEPQPAQWPQMQENEFMRSGTGRAEVLLNPCVVLHLDENSSLRMIANRLSGTRVELLAGSALVQDDSNIKDISVTVLVRGFSVLCRWRAKGCTGSLRSRHV
ncbi:exported hypothetical protein [Candidatus Sulfopaludibacter sp. SbA3]|nr:exported hypothetical protein [Candidatus Sulfopaludibacter sp. SbA3]